MQESCISDSIEDKFGIHATDIANSIIVSQDCGSGDGPSDKCSKECEQIGDENVLLDENLKQDNDAGDTFVKFKALHMSPPSNSCDGTYNQVVEDNQIAEVGNSFRDATLGKERKCSLSSSLKLTFRTVGGATTVCSGKEGKSSEVESLSTEVGNSSVNTSDYFTKLAEKALVDSSSDSESDSSSFCDEESFINAIHPIDDENKLKVKEEIPKTMDTSSFSIEKHIHVEQGNDKLLLSCIPARSAAVKAMTKMKPVLDDEIDDFGLEKGEKHMGSKKKHTEIHDKSCTMPITSKNAIYDCHYCNSLGASPLRTVKSHLANKHPKESPVVVNLKVRQWKKKSVFYVCPFSTCTKLFGAYSDLDAHRSTHPSLSFKSKETAHQSCSSANVSSLSSPLVNVPPECESILDCRVLLRPLSESELLGVLQYGATSPVGCSTKEASDPERYECLYCTEYFSHSTLPGMKLHYAAEHQGQLLVFRDMEAKKEKLASRIYACEESDCQFTAVSRVDLDAHVKCHKSNCTFVYECAACGWYSSSFWTAKDHLQEKHSIHDNGYLIHMQLSVDENGHTSRKVLRSV